MARKQKTALAQFFQDNPTRNQSWLAQELGVSDAYVSLMVAGKRQPKLPLAFRIQALTGVPMATDIIEEAKAS